MSETIMDLMLQEDGLMTRVLDINQKLLECNLRQVDYNFSRFQTEYGRLISLTDAHISNISLDYETQTYSIHSDSEERSEEIKGVVEMIRNSYSRLEYGQKRALHFKKKLNDHGWLQSHAPFEINRGKLITMRSKLP